MNSLETPAARDLATPLLLPRWVSNTRGQDPETAACSSGAALALLDVVMQDPASGLPAALLRDRMALQAAAACLTFEGRPASASDIRDAICLARAGDALGPVGEMFEIWRKAARMTLGVAGWHRQLAALLPETVVDLMAEFGPPTGSPVAQAAQGLSAILRRFPRHEAAALIWADVALARAVGWKRPVPLLAAQLKRADLHAIAQDAEGAALHVHHAMIGACDAGLRSAADLNRRAAKLAGIAPKLRTKGVEHALAVFLSHDAVSPSGMLSPTIRGSSFAMSDRAARRLCDRLVDLGAVREMTGRASFRLYGL